MTNRLGIIGIVIALIAIGIAAYQNEIRSQWGERGSSLIAAPEQGGFRLFGQDDDLFARDAVDYTYMGLGLIALIIGVVSFLKEEHLRVSGIAAVLGIMAMAWQYVLIGVAVAVVLIVIANLGLG